MTAGTRPRGTVLLVIFFLGATIILVVLTSRRLWLTPEFLSLAAAIAASSMGRFRQRKCAWSLASAQAGPPQVLG
jgi:hypothetical protein